MRLVERVACEIQYLVIDAVGDALRHAVCDRARDTAAWVSVDERDALRVDDLMLLLAHRAADHIGLTEREAREAAENFYDLLLIHNAAVGDGEYRTQQLMFITDLFRVHGALKEARYRIHRAGAVERYKRGDVLNASGLEAHADAGHARAFKLEHAACAPGSKHFIRRLIVLRRVLYAEIRNGLLHELDRIVKHGEVSEAEEVHLEKSQFLKRSHLVLAHGVAVVR